MGEPVWTAHNRPQEDNPARKAYIKGFTEKTRVPLAAHQALRYLVWDIITLQFVKNSLVCYVYRIDFVIREHISMNLKQIKLGKKLS